MEPASLKDLERVFSKIVRAVLPLSGIVLFLVLIIGGFKFITASGDPKQAEAAKKTLTFAILGFLLVASAYLILVLIAKITGVKEITIFQITR